MAEIISSNFVLIPGRYLVQMDEDSCIGTIVQWPEPEWGNFVSSFTTRKTFGPEEIPEPPDLPDPPVEVNYTRVIVRMEGAQEVNIDGVDYVLVHSNDILAFIPPD